MDYNIWDKVYFGNELDEANTVLQRRNRLGFIFIHTGIWLGWRYTQLSEPKPEKDPETRAFDENVWHLTTWKRLNYFGISCMIILLFLYFIHVSLSNIFGEFFWYFIVGFKLLGITVENISEARLENKMLLMAISCTIEVMESLCTFGAPDFLEFIKSFVLGLGVQMGERSIVNPLMDKFVDYFKDNLAKVTLRLNR